ncbi:MAG: Rieske (2Fe-2S) protein [Thaumarchaeota archaeon]|nr:Rieske (2Fe-2S) protein [Nitrososphaerota archaeon]
MNRREFVKSLVVGSVLIVTSVSGVYEIWARIGAGQQQSIQSQQLTTQTIQTGSSGTTQVQVPPGYVFVTTVGSLAGKTSAYFQHPSYGISLLISVNGQWKGFSATCTHQPCTVQYGGGSAIQCPCHGATFDPSNGNVLGGPAPSPLPEYGVQIDGSGNLFVTTSVIN